jgi:hypothetical protein
VQIRTGTDGPIVADAVRLRKTGSGFAKRKHLASNVQNNHIPVEFALEQNYPNPFNPQTTISYSLPRETQVILTIFDIMGREVKNLVSGLQQAGRYTISWNALNHAGKKLPAGIYYYRLQAGSFMETKKMILLP